MFKIIDFSITNNVYFNYIYLYFNYSFLFAFIIITVSIVYSHKAERHVEMI